MNFPIALPLREFLLRCYPKPFKLFSDLLENISRTKTRIKYHIIYTPKVDIVS